MHDSNIELNISLLDQRFLAGDRTLYAQTDWNGCRASSTATREDLVRNLAQLTHERHAKYADTFYHLEPNVKETPGGLRDYQLICWLTQIRETESGRLAAADPAPELRRRSASFPACAASCTTAPAATTTCSPSTRRMPRPSRRGSPSRSGCASTTGMRAHLPRRHAAAGKPAKPRPARCSRSSATGARGSPTPSSACTRERVHFRTPQQLDLEPELLLRPVRVRGAPRHPALLEAEQRIESRLPQICAWFEQPRALWPVLREMLTLPHAPLALRAMHDTGVLTAIFPELEGHRVPGDPRLLPPLHGGRAHARRHPESVGPARRR